MKKMTSLVTSSLLIALSNNAFSMDIRGDKASFYERNKPQRIGLNYTYLEAGYVNAEIDRINSQDTATVQSVDAGISFDLFNQFSGSLEINGNAIALNNSVLNTTELHAGFLYHYPIDKKADIYSSFKLISISIDDPNSTTALDASGQSISIGLRHAFTKTMEWGIKATFFDIDNEQFTQTRLSFSYGSDKALQYIVGYESNDATSKRKAFTAGIRFNF